MNARRSLVWRFALAAPALASCSSASSSPPADVSGVYSLSVRDNENGCNFQGWTPGTTASNIEFDVTQSEQSVSGQVKGAPAITLGVLGIDAFHGSASGNAVTLTATGTNSLKSGACAYFVKADVEFTLTGNAVNGTITYSDQTNGVPECGALSMCKSTQSISGSRPPK